MSALCSWERMAGNWTKGQFLYRIYEGAELLKAEISIVRIDEILSPELGGAQGLVGGSEMGEFPAHLLKGLRVWVFWVG